MRVLGSAFVGSDKTKAFRWPRKQADCAAHCTISEEAGGGATRDLYAIHFFRRDASPVDPSAERIVDRDSVPQDQRTARATRSEPPQRHTLRGRVRYYARRPPEQREARYGSQPVIEVYSGLLANFSLVQNRHKRRRFHLNFFG